MDLKITQGGFFLNLHGARRPVQRNDVVTVADEIGARLLEDGRAVPVDVEPDAAGEVTVDYDKLTADQLSGIASQRDLTVEGTGQDGRVLKADLVAALTAADEPQA